MNANHKTMERIMQTDIEVLETRETPYIIWGMR
jgi:hypothetical protein